MTLPRAALLLSLCAISAQATLVTFSGQVQYSPVNNANDSIAFSNIVLGSVTDPLTITQLDLTIGNGVNNVNATRSLFFDLPVGPNGFGNAGPYATSNNGNVTGATTILFPADGLSGRSLTVTYASWITGGIFSISVDVDRLDTAANAFSPGTGGSGCGSCNNITGPEFDAGGAITFTLWLAPTDPQKVINGPVSLTFGPTGWVNAGSNNRTFTWNQQVDVVSTEAAVPEAATGLLMAAGLFAIGIFRPRRAT